jgi:hypothetical protein
MRARLPILSLVALILPLALPPAPALADDFKAVAATDQAWRPRAAHLTLGEALQIAEDAAVKRGMSLADFQSPWFRYDYDLHYPDLGQGDYAWAFGFEGKVPAPANHFMVIVNDRTRYAQFIPGH